MDIRSMGAVRGLYQVSKSPDVPRCSDVAPPSHLTSRCSSAPERLESKSTPFLWVKGGDSTSLPYRCAAKINSLTTLSFSRCCAAGNQQQE